LYSTTAIVQKAGVEEDAERGKSQKNESKINKYSNRLYTQDLIKG